MSQDIDRSRFTWGRRALRAGLLLGCGLLFGACESGPLPGAVARAVSGQDGPLTVARAGTVVNRYAELAADAGAGTRSLQLRSAAALQPLQKGDLLLVIQMQGAAIDGSDSSRFGAVADLRGAGSFEYVAVGGVDGDTVTVDPACRLRNSYSAAGKTQVLRVPQVTTLRVEAGASVTAPPWNGAHGGVVAINVQEAAQIDGSIDVSGRGFRGGQLHNMSRDNDGTNVIYRSSDPPLGAEMGEGIAGSLQDYLARGAGYGRGAPANGGGGGNSHNAAGGGGANGNNGNGWSGQGVMDGTVVGASAWALDPGFKSNGNLRTASAGGGRGGYSFSHGSVDAPPDPTREPPGSMAWGGDLRREVGGLGGHPLSNDPQQRLFLGGGGGAGDENDGAATAGGSGGGLIALTARAVHGAGQLLADGATVGATVMNGNDGSGGAGAGGTVVVYAGQADGVRISANGGRGGNQGNTDYLDANQEAEGPGGGGGGGYIAVPAAANLQTSAAGGAGGTSAAVAMAKFPSNGATAGGSGQAREVAGPQPPICPTGDNGGDMGAGGGADQGTRGGADMAAPGGAPDQGSDKVRYVGGCSAAAAGGSGPAPALCLGVLLLLGLWLPRRRARRLLVLAVLLPFAGEARAQLSANTETFHPAIGPENIITVEGSRTSGFLRPMAVGMLEFSYHPLRLIRVATGETVANTVSTLTSLHLMGGLGVTSWLSLAADLPIVLYQSYNCTAPAPVPTCVNPTAAGVGDLRLVAKVRLLNNQHGGFGVAFVPQVTTPTGSGSDLRGDNAVGIEPRLAVDYKLRSGLIVALNIGFLGRTSDQTVYEMKVGSEVRYGLGGLLPITQSFAALAELAGGTSVTKASGGTIYSPFEGHIGGRYSHRSGLQVNLGLGGGFTQAVGSPQLRLFASIGYLPIGAGQAARRVPLSVVKTGSGSGTVNSDPPGIECGAACDAQTAHFPQDTEVVLTAQPVAGSLLVGWSGPCSGVDACRVPLREATRVSVEFRRREPEQATLQVEIKGPGTGQVLSEPPGIDCAADSALCEAPYAPGTLVRLTARPDKGLSFGGWSEGRCGLERTCEVPVHGKTRVTATFTRPIAPPKDPKMLEFEIKFAPCKIKIDMRRSGPVLEYYAHFLVEHPGIQLSVEGHTDDILCPKGGKYAGDNLHLSNDRAEAVAEALVEHVQKLEPAQTDLSALRQRLHTQGFGATCPIADVKKDRDARRKNRRTEFWEFLPGLGSTSECAHQKRQQDKQQQ